ncbi:MAG: hypothetical protein HY924_14355 [Elusimicrobia bacterium]|nr:hypothetical protein [Elusimicrobiota bacterium]
MKDQGNSAKLMQGTALKTVLRTDLRPALIGRLRMADWIEMPERLFAIEIRKIEKDPLFQKLFFGAGESPSAIRRQRWPRSRMALSFDEIGHRTVSGGERARVEDILASRTKLVSQIRKIGRQAFEAYFLHSDEPLGLAEIGRRVSIPLEDVKRIHDMLLEIGTQAEFEGPLAGAPAAKRYTCIARVWVDEDEPSFEFFSPHWARGRYHIRYDLMEEWKREGALSSDERRKLPHLIKRIETVNLRQNTVFRIVESLAQLQAAFLRTHQDDQKRPISLRQLAYRLDLAPSTVSRALSGRSVILPWGRETPLIALVPGRRKVLREILSRWLSEPGRKTDAALAARLRDDYGIRVSRRTVNAVRNELAA